MIKLIVIRIGMIIIGLDHLASFVLEKNCEIFNHNTSIIARD